MQHTSAKVIVGRDLRFRLPAYVPPEVFEKLHQVTPYNKSCFTIPYAATEATLRQIKQVYRKAGFELEFSYDTLEALKQARKTERVITFKHEGAQVLVQAKSFLPALVDEKLRKTWAIFDGTKKRWTLRQPGAILLAKQAFEKAGLTVRLEGFNFRRNLPRLKLPRTVPVRLFTFQSTAVKFIIQKQGRAGLFDDMGLGKTIEAMAATLELVRQGKARRILILAPSSLLFQWQLELHKRFNLQPTLVTSSTPKLDRADAFTSPLVLMNYELFLREHETILEKQFDTVILDEVTRVKSFNAKTSDAVKRILASNVIALTGTPLENRLAELHNIVTIIQPGYLGSWKQFVAEFANEDEFHNVTLKRSEVRKLRSRLRKISIRRTKKEVAKDLPELTTQWVTVKLAKSQQYLYDFLADMFVKTITTMEKNRRLKRESVIENPLAQQGEELRQLTLLREVCADVSMIRNYLQNMETRKDVSAEQFKESKFYKVLKELATHLEPENSKLSELLELLEALLVNEHKVVIFSQYAQIVNVISEALTKQKVSNVTHTGTISAGVKQTVLKQFKTNKSIKVLVASDSAQYGLNLQEADVVINYDLPWNPAKLQQRISRLHRIGQKNRVLAINLLVKDTVEENVKETLKEKADLFKTITGTDLIETEVIPVQLLMKWFGLPNLSRGEVELIPQEESKVSV
ncbi:MAG: DEAD/DEAH box helicase [Candidatus Bathyarchaeia archaeon]